MGAFLGGALLLLLVFQEPSPLGPEEETACTAPFRAWWRVDFWEASVD